MPNSPFSAAARKLARSHFPLTPGDDMPVEMTLGELATFAEDAMAQAAGRLDALLTASAEAFDRVYRAADAVRGVVRLLAYMEQDRQAQEAANLLELVADRLQETGCKLEMACREAAAVNHGGSHAA